MNVNEKGVRGLIKVIDDVSEKGHYCFPSFDDHSPVDLVVMNSGGELLRLQVKYREPIKNKCANRYEISARSIVNGKQVPIDRTMIDGWAVYLSDSKEVKYISIKFMENRKSLTINPSTDYGGISWLN